MFSILSETKIIEKYVNIVKVHNFVGIPIGHPNSFYQKSKPDLVKIQNKILKFTLNKMKCQ